MRKQIDKSLQLAHELFPDDCAARQKYKTFHYAFGFHRTTLLAIGQNRMEAQDAKGLKMSKRFGIRRDYHGRHAEMDLVSKLWGRVYVDSRLILIVIRINKFGELQESKPCKYCQPILDALGVTKVAWSCKDGTIYTGV